jgi:very-short-patch-repair endonuclease
VQAGIPRPVCNLDIVVEGEWLARADLAWPENRVIVEYDGAVHLDERQRRADAARRNLLQDAGWLVITFTAADLRRPWAMANLVRSALNSRPPDS